MDPQPPSEVSVHDAVKIAMAMHRAGEIGDAETLYQRILQSDPGHVDVMHGLGLIARQRNQGEVAADWMRRAIAANPQYLSAHNNLGNLLLEKRDYQGALEAFQNALLLDPQDVRILNNLGVVKRNMGDVAGAREVFERAAALAPEFALPLENLGRHFYSLGDIKTAHEYFCRAVVADPRLAYSNLFLGMALRKLGRLDEARAHYTKWAQFEPDNPVPKHMLHSVSQGAPPARASDDYVRTVFDSFAETFDEQLKKLDYCAPELVVGLLHDEGVAPGAGLKILDAGCGTGLCGALLRPLASHLAGVDLSSKMLEAAKSSAVYDVLTEGELTAFLASHVHAWDVVTSADTLCYFGDLAAVANAASRALRPGGALVFSVEALLDSEDDYRMDGAGRYVHHQRYLRQTLAAAGFLPPRIEHHVLRQEAGEGVQGHVVLARMPGQPSRSDVTSGKIRPPTH